MMTMAMQSYSPRHLRWKLLPPTAVNPAAAARIASNWRSCPKSTAARPPPLLKAAAFELEKKLRTKLHHLHAEAESIRSKANTARLRLMRLTEAAENLKRLAANNVLVGKEKEARELLIQKKKLMQVLEKSKNHIQVLDKLLSKINEAISIEESQLIEQVSVHQEANRQYCSQQIGFVSSKNDISGFTDLKSLRVIAKSSENEELDGHANEATLSISGVELDNLVPAGVMTSNNGKMDSKLNSISSYLNFLEFVDTQLQLAEREADKFLESESLMEESSQIQIETSKQNIKAILKDVRSIRERIAGMMKEAKDTDGDLYT